MSEDCLRPSNRSNGRTIAKLTAPVPRRQVRDVLCEAAAALADLDTDGTTNDLRDRLIETGKRIIWEGTRP